jgi:AcrR family transcriptional regulator
MKNVTKEKIMHAALENMSLHGFKGTTTKCLAQLAGVNEATIFKHFKGKDELIHEALELEANKIKSEIDMFFHTTHDNIRDLLLAKFEFIHGIYEKYKPFFMITAKEMGSKELNFLQPTIFEYITQELEKEIANLTEPKIPDEEISAISLIANSVTYIKLLERVKDDLYGRPTKPHMDNEKMVNMLIRLWEK